MIRTRIAPSPTGENLHIGNVYTALLNFAFARKNKGKFIIRIEDTDRTRLVKGAEEKILSSLKWFGLLYDEGPDIGGPYAPYRQSDRKETYQKYAIELVKKKHAYYCFCTPARLEEMRKIQQEKKQQVLYDGYCKKYTLEEAEEKSKNTPHVIRMKVPEQGLTEFEDLLRGKISFENKFIDDQVLLKSDGFPTYHLGVVVDDHLMDISHVIRAEEWISSTPKHVLLYNFFGWELPVFAHTPILRSPDKSKLSKRKNPVWASWYQQEGYLPQAILNYLALMGWSHPKEKEIFSLNEFVSYFDLKDIKPVGPIFDIRKLEWMNGMYIREMDIEEFISVLENYETNFAKMSFVRKIDQETLKKIALLAQSRINTLKEFYPLASHFIKKPNFETKLSEKEQETAKDLYQRLKKIDLWTKEKILEELRGGLKSKGIKMNVYYKILTGLERGLPLPESIEILGKDNTLKRLKNIAE